MSWKSGKPSKKPAKPAAPPEPPMPDEKPPAPPEEVDTPTDEAAEKPAEETETEETEKPARVTRSRNWQATGVRSKAREQAKARGVAIAGVAFTILLLLGALVAWLFYLDPKPSPYTLGIWISNYADPSIPVNPWADQDRTAWLALPLKDKNAFPSQQRDLLVKELSNLDKIKNLDEPVLVYLNAFALTDPETGKVYLLPSDAGLNPPTRWLAVEDVLKPLRLCPAKNKLLILDLAAPFTDPGSGILSADVAVHLEPLLQSTVKQHPNLQILAACRPGQVSLASEDLGHSVFAFFLLQGLLGDADGHNPAGVRDSQVSLQELVNYVTTEVDRWAWTNRRLRQTPVLYGESRDYRLVPVDERRPGTGPAPLEAAYPDWLRGRWELRGRWWDDERFRTQPQAFRELEAALLRADRRWRGGVKQEQIDDKDLAPKIRSLDRNDGAAVGRAGPVRSLALAVAVQGRQRPNLREGNTLLRFRDLLRVYRRVQQKPAPGDEDKLEKDSEEFLKDLKEKPFELACFLFDALAAEPDPSADQVGLTLKLLDRAAPAADFAETQFVQKLARIKPADPKDWPGEAVHLALQVVSREEQVAATPPQAMDWVRERRHDAEEQRRAAEDALLSGTKPAQWLAAQKTLAAADSAFKSLLDDRRTLQAAQRARDEALVLLPGYSGYLLGNPLPDRVSRDFEGPWFDAVQVALDLHEVLQLPRNNREAELGKRREKMRSLTEKWRNAPARLIGPLREEPLKAIMDQTKRPRAADWWEMSALLEIPWLPAGKRAALATAWRGLGARLQKESRDGGLPALEPARALREERDRALLRARCSVGLLRLAHVTADGAAPEEVRKARQEELTALAKALDQAQQGPAESLSPLALLLRQAWKPYRSGGLGPP